MLKTAEIAVPDIRVLLIGRQFILPGGGWLIVGRDEKDNIRLEKLAQAEDAVLLMEDWPGPLAVLKKAGSQYPDQEKLARDIELAASLVVRYAKKLPKNMATGEVTCTLGITSQVIQAEPLADDIFRDWGLN